jgi:hypothetical protein
MQSFPQLYGGPRLEKQLASKKAHLIFRQAEALPQQETSSFLLLLSARHCSSMLANSGLIQTQESLQDTRY